MSQICPVDTAPHSWCTYQANDFQSIIVEYTYLSILAIFIYAIVKPAKQVFMYRSIRTYALLFGQAYAYVYILLITWLVGSICCALLNILVFQLYMTNQISPQAQDPEITDPLVLFSALFTLLRFLNAYIVNLLILMIGYKWLHNVISSTTESNGLTMKHRKKMQKWFKVLRAVRIYYKYGRILYLIVLIAQPFAFVVGVARCSYPNFKQPSSNHSFYYVIGQTALILAFYTFGLSIFNELRTKKLVNIEAQDMNRIRIQFTGLMVAEISRITINSFLSLFPNIYTYLPNQSCWNVSQDKINTTVLLCLHYAIMHLLPISTILYIYHPTTHQTKMHKHFQESLQRQRQQGSFYDSTNRVLIEDSLVSSAITYSNRDTFF